MEFHIINIIYAALHMRAQTEKTTFSCKDDQCKDYCTLTMRTWRWTYSALRYFFILNLANFYISKAPFALFYSIQGVSKKNFTLGISIISPVINMLEGWGTSHLKGGIYSSVWNTKIFLYDIREPRYKHNNVRYQISRI